MTVVDKTSTSSESTEQFNLTPGGTYWFDLSGENIPGTVNSNLPDSTLHYVPFTYVGTVNAYKLTSETATTEEYAQQNKYAHSLFVADYAVTHKVNWNNLDTASLIFGKNYASGGVDYTLRAPSVGSNSTGSGDSQRGVPQSNEWDTMLNKNSGYIQNWNEMYSWGQDTVSFDASFRAVRGYYSARYWYDHTATYSGSDVGFRPVLELPTDLAADSLKVVELFTKGRMPGETYNRINIIVKKGESFKAPAAEGLPRPDGISADALLWWKDEKGNYYKPGDTVPAENITITAQWKINQYTITFDTAGGSEVAPITQDYNTQITAPANPTREGYAFNGWDKEIPQTMPAENITITAQWKDTEKPTGEIIIGTNKWSEFLNELTSGLFFKDTQTVTINASDNSGIVFISYLVTDQDLSEAELKSLVYRAYEEPFRIEPNGEYIVYAMLVDASLNITYLRSDRITLDNIPPVISGIEDGKTYCEAQTVTIAEKYIDTVTVNGTAVTLDENGRFVLSPANGKQKIVVTDKAGNTAEMTVTVNDGHTLLADDNDCTTPVYCKFCNAELIAAKSHRFTGNWQNDETGHWHECSTCGKKLDLSVHIPNRASATETEPVVCTVCGYLIEAAHGHIHNITGYWEKDEENHWHSCTGCDLRFDLENHVFTLVADKRNAGSSVIFGHEECVTCGLKKGSLLYGIEPGTTVEKLKKALGKDIVVNGAKNGLVGTGTKVVVGGKEYTVIIKGDTDGDGKITATDYIRVRLHILKRIRLDGEKLLAAHASTEIGKNVSAADYIAIRLHILKKKLIVQ